MNIADLYITNYRENGGLPFQSITRLPDSKAYDFARMDRIFWNLLIALLKNMKSLEGISRFSCGAIFI